MVNENEINNFDEFVRVFKHRFWSPIIQKNIKKKIEFSHFDMNGKQTRTVYAMEMCTLAQELDIEYNEKSLVNDISSHFDREVRAAIKRQGINSTEELFTLLDEFDTEVAKKKVTSSRNNNYQNRNNNNNSYEERPRQSQENSSDKSKEAIPKKLTQWFQDISSQNKQKTTIQHACYKPLKEQDDDCMETQGESNYPYNSCYQEN